MFNINKKTLREKCPYSKFFCSIFSDIQTENGEIRIISPYLAKMWENADQKNSEYEHFLRGELLEHCQCKKNILLRSLLVSYYPVLKICVLNKHLPVQSNL